jgi:hypothetical protein
MGTVSGSTLGGYLGSIYGTRIEDQPEHELKEALGEQKLILIAHIEETEEELAREIMQEAGGSYLKTHEVSREAIAEITG